jgi:hypothetical protein
VCENRGRRRRSPSASGSPAQTPLSAKEDESDLRENRIAIQIKIFIKGGLHGVNRAGSAGAVSSESWEPGQLQVCAAPRNGGGRIIHLRGRA